MPTHNFQEASQGRRPSLLIEFFHYLAVNKKWWLLPILIVLLLLCALVLLAGTGMAPFIYPLF